MPTNLTKRQSEIIQSAIQLIGEGGIQALTIKNLSAKIGVTESAIYRHFDSKIKILETLLDFIKENITERNTQASLSKKNALARINDMVTYQLDSYAANPAYAIVILSDGLYQNEVELRNKIYAIMEAAKATFIGIIEDGMKAGEIRNDIPSNQLAFIIMGSVRLTINQWSLSDFSFDLLHKGKVLLKTINTLIKK